MTKLRLLLTMIIVLAAVGVQAQDGTNPYVGSTHTYEITKGMTESTLAWSIPNATIGGTPTTPILNTHYKIISGGGDAVSIEIQWLIEGIYTVELSETRTLASGFAGCPTVRQKVVTVGSNNFDVYAELKVPTDADACATIDPSVVIDGGTLGDNSDDVFGLTTREFVITAAGATGNWDYTYTLTNEGESVGNLKVNGVDYDASFASGKTITNIGVPTQNIKVTYTTNDDRQDQDFDLVLTIISAKDALNTPDGDGSGADVATYKVRAVPATTGITTD